MYEVIHIKRKRKCVFFSQYMRIHSGINLLLLKLLKFVHLLYVRGNQGDNLFGFLDIYTYSWLVSWLVKERKVIFFFSSSGYLFIYLFILNLKGTTGIMDLNWSINEIKHNMTCSLLCLNLSVATIYLKSVYKWINL